MKHKGNKVDFLKQRDAELMRVFKAALHDADHIDMDEIGRKMVETPCSRFWVSEERATAVISAVMRGEPILQTMRGERKEMFEELADRVSRLRTGQPQTPLYDIVLKAVHSPAPKFYLTARYAMQVIYRMKKDCSRNR